jgi:DNA helicase-2/ATP-dependent DNA helicase PcrA
MPSHNNLAVLAAAGARKTQRIVEEVTSAPEKRFLVTTYTLENLRQLERRIAERAGGVIPPNVTLMSWFSFLLRDGVRPYQASVFQETNFVQGLNFVSRHARGIKIENYRHYFLDRSANAYRDDLSHLADICDAKSGGKVIQRLESLYDHVFIDEVQDLVGYDLEVLDRLFKSRCAVTIVGDLRQHTYATNYGTKNKPFRGEGFLRWLEARKDICTLSERHESYRCNQAICDFASALFPDMNPLKSVSETVTEHDGIFRISPFEVQAYYEKWRPQVLRYSKKSNTFGLPAMNFGTSKGSTFDRVLIIPTNPMKKYLDDQDVKPLKSKEKFYVAVTRARHSVTFVV